MKFEKLNENKIRITLSTQDLIEKNIDFKSFMSSSIESQDLFLDMLAEAEQKIGFITKDHRIRIEALAMEDGDFIVTITRFGKKEENTIVAQTKSKKIKAKRKTIKLNSENLVYEFNSFDDFCEFSSYASKIKNLSNIANSTILYTYKNKYYLVFSKINYNHYCIKSLFTLITEFGSYIHNSDLFISKLNERGKIIIKNNAIRMCIKYFK